MAASRTWIDKVRNLHLPRKVRVMSVSGGHERAITHAGLRDALPEQLELVPGPGCPVCVCPEEDIELAIRIARSGEATLVAFEDVLRVPAPMPPGEPRTLEEARVTGADVRAVQSAPDAWRLAAEHPERTLVFFATGFETTMAPLAARICQGLPRNLLLLVSGRLTPPAVSMLLEHEDRRFDALIVPGHVSTLMGPEQWSFVVEQHAIPTAIAGFASRDILVALHSVLRQWLGGRAHLDNCDGRSVRAGGNALARRLMDEVFEVIDAPWRGIGRIRGSGLRLASSWRAHDARDWFREPRDDQRPRVAAASPDCSCPHVVLGQTVPNACALYGSACTPKSPKGPCMGSREGTCRIWFSAGVGSAHCRAQTTPT